MQRSGCMMVALVGALVSGVGVRPARAQARAVPLDARTRLDVRNGQVQFGTYRGRAAMHLMPLAEHAQATDLELSALLVDSDFTDGVIEVDVAGRRREGYATDDASAFKGFIGVSFRVRGDTAERFYLRTENARLPRQLFRNRTTQYEASPGYEWQRLRAESPGVYESYVDVEAGAWTALRIEVQGQTAKLFVNGAAQPALVVNDLRHGASRGRIALWTRVSADAWFSNLRITPAAPAAGGVPAVREVVRGRADTVTFRGARAIHLAPHDSVVGKDVGVFAMLDDADFGDGTIEVTLAGVPRRDAPADSRGFVGVSLRTGPQAAWAEVMYLRPANARADDQLRRNHTTQYISEPDYPWPLLRREAPGVYESHADLDADGWTTVRVDVSGTTARLYVNGASEPALVVSDLKLGARRGRVALWAHAETDGYFRDVRVTRR